MASPLPSVVVSFMPILSKICSSLDLPQPIYNTLDVGENVAFVLIPKRAHPSTFLYTGDKASTLQESYESAAKKMVKFLVRTNNIVVHDVNLEVRRNIEHYAQLFRMQRAAFNAMEEGVPCPREHKILPVVGVDCSHTHVEVDFLDVLRVVVQRVQVNVTPIEVMRMHEGQFKSWFTISRLRGNERARSFIGDTRDTVDGAKQSLAKKAVSHLMDVYQFEVEDVNYHLLYDSRLALQYERESYISIKERVYGLKEEVKPQPYIVEQDQLTPCSEKAKIPLPVMAPLPPKKRKPRLCHNGFSSVVPSALIPPELQTVFKRKKQE